MINFKRGLKTTKGSYGLAAPISFLAGGFGKDTTEGLMFQDVGARPGDISYEGISDPSGRLQDAYSFERAGLGDFQTRLRDEAKSDITGVSQAGRLGLDAQRRGQLGLEGRLASQLAASSGQAQAQMAARGGISSGERGRMMSQQAMQHGLGRQDIAGQGVQQRLGMEASDYAQQQARRQGLSGVFASQEEARKRFDLSSAISDQQKREQFKQDKYKTDMAEWAAAKEAAQQEHMGATTGGIFGKGGFLGMGVK